MTTVTFHFDPICPWTWRASRWLVAAAGSRPLDLQWRALSLALVNEGRIPDEHSRRMAASLSALRLVEVLHAAGQDAAAGDFYTRLGTAVHEERTPMSAELVAEVAARSGVGERAAALGDAGLDALVREATDLAIASAGPDVGSPVLVVEGAERGLHGPILDAVPDPAAGQALWDAIAVLAPMGSFYEIKRGRR